MYQGFEPLLALKEKLFCLPHNKGKHVHARELSQVISVAIGSQIGCIL